tara:strand:+ start:413 stop:1555 length:1143 start_codon:yes stop_codon:yes gene_type:complete
MKAFYTLLIIFIPFFGFGQYLCSQLVVNNVVIDSTSMNIDFEIYDGNFSGQPYPYIAFTVDNNGDTIQFGNLDSFGNIGLDTNNYSYTLNSFPIYPLTIFYVYGMNSDTCNLFYDTMQNTYIPDDNFEQALIDLGYDDVLDDSVITANISSVKQLFLNNLNIVDLTGIEDFNELELLNVSNNEITSIDISQNLELTILDLDYNQLTTIDVSQNLELTDLSLDNNQLTTIDVSQNTDLENLFLRFNSLITVVLNNPNMWQATFSGNQLMSLDISSFNCNSFAELTITEPGWLKPIDDNPNLDCILVNDSSCWNNNFSWSINDNQLFSETCFKTSFLLENNFSQKRLRKITNILGQEIIPQTNKPVIEIFDDGTIEKKIFIE